MRPSLVLKSLLTYFTRYTGDVESQPLDDGIAAISALADPHRRALYGYVVRERRPVSRDEAAEAVSLPRTTAAFHLDRLVTDGLLDTEYRRLSGRGGPGAGRPSKLYRRAGREIAVSLPPRSYDLAGQILASAVTDATRTGEPVHAVLERVARAHGVQMGAARPKRRTSARARIAGILADHGFEPELTGRRVVLANCPFHSLAENHRELVCGMNRALLEGVIAGAEGAPLTAVPECAPGRCCVSIAPRKES